MKSNVTNNVMAAIIATAFLTGCSNPTVQEQLIAQHVQTIDGGGIADLGFEAKEVTKIKDVTGMDSAISMCNEYFGESKVQQMGSETAVKELMKTLDEDIAEYNNKIKEYTAKAKSARAEYNKIINGGGYLGAASYLNDERDYQEWTESNKSRLAKREKTKSILTAYLSNKDKPLCTMFECKYTIKNPKMNNVEVEKTNRYLFNMDNTKIIGINTDLSQNIFHQPKY